MYRTRIGEVEIISLKDIEFAFPVANIWPQTRDSNGGYRQHLEPDGQVRMDDLCFLLRADGRTVLVDTGMGPESDGKLIEELRASGVRPKEIDTVVFTHLHADHVGWNIDRQTGEPLFGNARYLVPRADWDRLDVASPPSPSFVRDVKPLQTSGQFDLIEGSMRSRRHW